MSVKQKRTQTIQPVAFRQSEQSRKSFGHSGGGKLKRSEKSESAKLADEPSATGPIQKPIFAPESS
jgi:hypothetical protein